MLNSGGLEGGHMKGTFEFSHEHFSCLGARACHREIELVRALQRRRGLFAISVGVVGPPMNYLSFNCRSDLEREALPLTGLCTSR